MIPTDINTLIQQTKDVHVSRRLCKCIESCATRQQYISDLRNNESPFHFPLRLDDRNVSYLPRKFCRGFKQQIFVLTLSVTFCVATQEFLNYGTRLSPTAHTLKSRQKTDVLTSSVHTFPLLPPGDCWRPRFTLIADTVLLLITVRMINLLLIILCCHHRREILQSQSF